MYAEVETRIGALRSLLLEKLLQTPSTLHDQKRYIRSLYNSMTLFKFGYFSLHVYSVSIQQKVMTSPSTPFGFFDVCLCHRLPELQPPPPSLFLFFPLSLSSVHQSYFCCLALLFLLLFFSPPVFLFLLFFHFIHLSIHTCGLCLFIIVKTNLSGSQRPALNHMANGNIFHPGTLGTALNAHSAPVYSSRGV